MYIRIPDEVAGIIGTLEANGFEAYAVGGCVRDAVMGKEPMDWDVCTSALPEQTLRCFEGYRIIETGLQHGTLTLVIDHRPYEITTYRVEGLYSDSRHPDSVKFVSDLREDLSRRDLSINAMAYNPNKGLVDYFGGRKDIERCIIRSVGDADKRFQEDALRIMRALRFASVLDFKIEEATSAAIYKDKGLLRNIAVERIVSELNALLLGENVENVLLDYAEVFEVVIPEIGAMVGFDQKTPYHFLDVWRHTVRSVSEAPSDLALRLTMLLHDIAKPRCYSEVDAVRHFSGHPQVSTDMARQILLRLKYDRNTVNVVTQLIRYHDTALQPQARQIKRWLNRLGERRFRQLIEVKRADAMAQAAEYRYKRLQTLHKVITLLDEIIKERQCYSLEGLAVDGNDLLAAGVPEGREVGATLNRLLDMIIDETIENEREQLLKEVKNSLPYL